MSHRVVFRRAACDDLVEIASFIAADNSTAAERFLDRVLETIEHLQAMPHLGRLMEFATPLIDPELSGIRTKTVNHFRNYSIYYFVHPDRIEIVRILHGMRDVDDVFDADDDCENDFSPEIDP